MNVPPERRQQLVDAIWDRACGYRLFLAGGKKPGGKEMAGQEVVGTLTLLNGEVLEGHVYTVPGDPATMKLLVEHGVGRPAQREMAKQDMVVNLICRLPEKRKATAVTASEGEGGDEYCEADLVVAENSPSPSEEFSHLDEIDLTRPWEGGGG